MRKLSILEQLDFCTTRIKCKDKIGNKVYGSGFFFTFSVKEEGKGFVYLVTNRHVIEGMHEIEFGLSQCDKDGNPLFMPPLYHVITKPFEGILYHPNPTVDLCAIPVTLFLTLRKQMGTNIFYRTLSIENIPTKEQLNKLDVVEDILLVGYPNGLWDEKNNVPLIRKGITATPPYLNYNGKREFLIDAACFPGSSGSPIFIVNNGLYRAKDSNAVVVGSRFYFMGILYGGPQSAVRGSVVKDGAPLVKTNVSTISMIPNNLGMVIHSDVMRDFISLVENNVK